jgi:hypothetical protein
MVLLQYAVFRVPLAEQWSHLMRALPFNGTQIDMLLMFARRIESDTKRAEFLEAVAAQMRMIHNHTDDDLRRACERAARRYAPREGLLRVRA